MTLSVILISQRGINRNCVGLTYFLAANYPQCGASALHGIEKLETQCTLHSDENL